MDIVKLQASLATLLPGRKKQTKQLLGLLGGGGAVPSSIFVFGHTATGKTHVVTTVLEQLRLNYVQVNCVEFDSPALLAAPLAAKISEVYLDDASSKKCTTLMDLVNVMEKAAESPDNKENPFVIVLERGERLRSMPHNTLPALLRLRELSGMNVCVLVMSDIVWEKFYGRSWFTKPLKIFFPQYNQDESLQILLMQKPSSIPEKMYKAYVDMLIRVLFRFCRDLNELKYMVDQHLPLVQEHFSKSANVTTLWNILQPSLKTSTQKLHLRQGIGKVTSEGGLQLNPLTSTVSGLELPYYAKFLLISAFLASFNAPKYDKRLFMKFHSKERKRLATKAQKRHVKQSSLLVGPKPFNFERLAAIFYAVADTPCGLTTNLCAQLTTLVNLKLITRVGYSGISDPKYKCAAGLGFISTVGETVQFNVSKYIVHEH